MKGFSSDALAVLVMKEQRIEIQMSWREDAEIKATTRDLRRLIVEIWYGNTGLPESCQVKGWMRGHEDEDGNDVLRIRGPRVYVLRVLGSILFHHEVRLPGFGDMWKYPKLWLRPVCALRHLGGTLREERPFWQNQLN